MLHSSSSTTASTSAPTSNVSTNPVFLQGLEAILAPYYARGASVQEIQDVTERAHAFFLQSQTAAPTTEAPVPAEAPAPAPAPSSLSQAADPNTPPYPVSFSALAALIASGAPIPGIKDIPDKLAEGEPSVSTIDVRKVKKPWEVAAERKEGREAEMTQV